MPITNHAELSLIEIEPDLPAKKSVIWLHGLGADGHDFVPLIEALQLPTALGVRFIFPHAPLMPVTLNQGYTMRAWYDIESLRSDANIDKPGIAKSVTALTNLITRETSRGMAFTDIILGGFSQGAVIALTTALTFPQLLGGVIALSGYLPFAEEIVQQARSFTHRLPIFLAHGTEDDIVPYAFGQAIFLALKEGYPLTWHSYRMAHTVAPEEVKDISQWLQSIINDKPAEKRSRVPV